MSQMTAVSSSRPSRGPRRGPRPPSLRVTPKRIATTGHGGFAMICLALLTVGLIALLVLNTALAQGSLAVGQLQRESANLANTTANLSEQISAASSSGTLAAKATEMGMVRANERAYIDLSTGTVTGTAYPATSYQAFPLVTSPTPPPPPPPVTASDQKLLTTATASVLAAVGSLAAQSAPPPPPPASDKPSNQPSDVAPATPKTPGAAPTAPVAPRLGTNPSSPAQRGGAQPSSQTPAAR